jgi:hypothetical protein
MRDYELGRIAKEGEQKEAAELAAAIECFERTGRNPPGYEFPWKFSNRVTEIVSRFGV